MTYTVSAPVPLKIQGISSEQLEFSQHYITEFLGSYRLYFPVVINCYFNFELHPVSYFPFQYTKFLIVLKFYLLLGHPFLHEWQW